MFRRRPPASDTESLVARIARGDRDALGLVYRAESGEVYRFALAMCGNAAWAADAVQDAFVHLTESPRGFDPARGPLRAWLCGIARHRLLARWRESSGRWLAEVDGDDDAPQEEAAPGGGAHESAESMLVRVQDHEALWAAIRELPWAFREALVLVDLQERPYAEAAQIAGCELNTLRTRVHRARQKLACALAPCGEMLS